MDDSEDEYGGQVGSSQNAISDLSSNRLEPSGQTCEVEIEFKLKVSQKESTLINAIIENYNNQLKKIQKELTRVMTILQN